MIIKKAVNPLGENTYLLLGKESVLIIDPGIGFIPGDEDIAGLPVSKIILTHGHFDHIYGTCEIVEKHGATVYIHEDDADFLKDRSLCDPIDTGLNIDLPRADVFLKDGDVIDFEGTVLKVIHTPGHTPGSMCIATDNAIFSGDTLFQGTVGRTDCPRSSLSQMKASLKKLSGLKGNTVVYPGHGHPTTIQDEQATFSYYG